MESSVSSSTKALHEVKLLGILSDTHDRFEAAAAGIKMLRAAGAEYLIHCGDVGGQCILDLLVGIPCTFVWGNCDFDRAELTEYARDLGLDCAGEMGSLEISGKNIAVTHGDNPKLLRQIAESRPGYDYLFVGHTHIASDQREGNLRIVNPGALHRAARKTVALVDLGADTVRYLHVPI
jgi:putative phosphoesterase